MKPITRELNDEELGPVVGGLAQGGAIAVKFQIGGETMVISADANSYSVNTSWGYNTLNGFISPPPQPEQTRHYHAETKRSDQ